MGYSAEVARATESTCRRLRMADSTARFASMVDLNQRAASSSLGYVPNLRLRSVGAAKAGLAPCSAGTIRLAARPRLTPGIFADKLAAALVHAHANDE